MSSKKQLDALGDRMKTFERLSTDVRMIPGLPIYVRLDGRGFSNFTRKMTRPYDPRMSALMQATTEYLVKEFNATLGYVQSDEISLIIRNEYESPAIFEGKVQKLTSTLAASATAFFNAKFEEFFKASTSDFNERLPTFDCRLFNIPSWDEAANSILWRYLDALKNSKQMLAHHHFSHTELQNHNGKQLVDKLEVEKGVIWADFPDFFKSGVFVQRYTFSPSPDVIRHAIAPVDLLEPFHLLTHEQRIDLVQNNIIEEVEEEKIVETQNLSLESRIQSFLKDKEQTILNIETLPLEEFKTLMEGTFEYKEDSDQFDTNGWQTDFWMYFEKEGCQCLQLEGSLYYGGYKLSKVVED